MKSVSLIILILLVCIGGVSAQEATPDPAQPPTQAVELLVPQMPGYPHDATAYTQGLLLHEGQLYESAGQYGESSLRRVEITTGEVLQRFDLTRANLEAAGWLDDVEAACTLTLVDPANANSGEIFAEGLALVDDRLIQLSWKEECALVYDRATFEIVDVIRYDDTPDMVDEGWGLCYDGDVLYMSDGSATLTVRDAQTFARLNTIPVIYNGEPLNNLNELECVGDVIYANVYRTPFIVRIDKAAGVVNGIISVTNMLTRAEQVGIDVLNGIAHIPDTDRFLITGKYWSRLFEVRFVTVTQQPF
ncbi:MAG: glutaminyl-peptide cyclotransferase [Chloroflexota bacterium]|nr:glutaminyl-peptide cyclotransferase [Chloroflexota bacterium]